MVKKCKTKQNGQRKLGKKLPPLEFEPQSFKVISLSITPYHQVLKNVRVKLISFRSLPMKYSDEYKPYPPFKNKT